MNNTIVIVIESEEGIRAIPLSVRKGSIKVTCIRLPDPETNEGLNQTCIFPGKEEENSEE